MNKKLRNFNGRLLKDFHFCNLNINTLNEQILKEDVQEFITSFNGDVTTLAFAGSPFKEITIQELIQQIEGKKKTFKKLPLWHQTANIYYPTKLSIEQTSSQITATYKASIINGHSLIDVTGGWGVDSYYFSKRFQKVTYYEINKDLASLASHNFEQLKAENITCHSGNGIKGIKNTSASVIYIDPARRNNIKGKVFMLSDCEPNVPKQLDYLLERCDTLLIKASPMLDVSKGITELKYVTEIHCVAVQNEMKELLFVIRKNDLKDKTITIKTINIFSETEKQTFDFQLNTNYQANYSHIKKYLYEPNSAILKSGGFQALSAHLNIAKIALHSHLYTNDTLVDFPGRRFEVTACFSYNKKEMKQLQKLEQLNITTRNFPLSVANIRKKWKLKDGGAHYVFFTTTMDDKKVVVVCKKC